MIPPVPIDARRLRPLSDRILVRRLDTSDKDGSIVMPEIGKPKSLRGIVLAVGPGKRNAEGERIPVHVEVGQVVYFGPFTDLEHDDWVMIREPDVRGLEYA